jgi:glycosyltransferase involved in cell wall biosynthesis
MPAAFAAAHVAVVGSIEPEAFGRAAAEAQALGCPVIATDIGAPPETVRAQPHVGSDETTGWLVPPGDERALADAITTALDLAPESRAAMGARARVNVETRYTLEAMQVQTMGVYRRLIGPGLSAGEGKVP